MARRWSSGLPRPSKPGRSFWSVSQKKRASDSRARITRSLPATIAAPPSFASMFETRMKRFVSRPVEGVAQHEAFLVGADRRLDRLVGHVEEGLVEGAHQHDRPFDEARRLVEHRLVLDEVEPDCATASVAGVVSG